MKNSGRTILCVVFCCLVLYNAGAETPFRENLFLVEDSGGPEDDGARETDVPLSLLFHDLGWNALHSLTYNYGLNFIGAGAGTWALVASGLDWKWRNLAYNNEWLADAGLPILFSGYLVPVLVPVSFYIAGRITSDTKMRITALALAQALLLSQAAQVSIKMITGRSVPGIVSDIFFEPGQTRDTRTKDFSGDFNGFTFNFYDGWPSGHVLSAFSAAAVLAELYDDKPLLKAGAYAYAVLMGIGVSVNAHWASDSVAGALMGYAIGKTVGISFNRLLGKKNTSADITPLITANTIGMSIRF